MPDMVDLHIHTNHSDGFYSPKEIVDFARRHELEIISITDHDNLAAIKEAQAYGKQFGIEVIPGLEISSDVRDKEIHILAYLFDVDNEELGRYLIFFRQERVKRAIRMVEKLNEIGLNITIDDVLSIAKNSAVGRPHVAQALVAKGLVSSYFEAFYKYIGNGCPAYEKKVHLSPQSAFKIISDAGGLSFIAHPGNMSEALIKELIDDGVDGIEVVHPSHSSQLVKYYKGIVNEYFLLESGGSDFHGGKREDEKSFGKFTINRSIVTAMQRRLSRSNK